ncbi:MAG TPA: hypothetical protein DD725_12140 [Deltaproteobacteria bacterium]|nr:hypothetical protein [Deltaproteobacteria bacterium]
MTKLQKLELTWIGKDNQPKLEPRILIEDPEKSYGHTPRPSQEGNKMGVSQEGNKHTPNPLSRGEYKRPLLGRETGVRTNKDGEL